MAEDTENTRERPEPREERESGRGGGGYGGGRRGRGGFGGGRGGFGGGRRGRSCPFCQANAREVDYKNPEELRRYLTERGKIKARRKNATCAKHQRRLAIAIKRARQLALLPFSTESTRG